jgi:hypothetical protein
LVWLVLDCVVGIGVAGVDMVVNSPVVFEKRIPTYAIDMVIESRSSGLGGFDVIFQRESGWEKVRGVESVLVHRRMLVLRKVGLLEDGKAVKSLGHT